MLELYTKVNTVHADDKLGVYS